jgi:hypothetical protein
MKLVPLIEGLAVVAGEIAVTRLVKPHSFALATACHTAALQPRLLE